MSEEPTQKLPDQRSFEDRVLARFDDIDSRLERLESRNYDTKPIWERALQAIMDTGLEVGEIKTRVGVIEDKVGVIEDKVGVIGNKIGVIEDTVGVIGNKVGVIGNKVGVIEGKVGVIEDKVGVIENKVGVIEDKVGVVENKIQLLDKEVGAMKISLRNELVDVRRALSHKIRDRLDLIVKYLHEDREDIRDAEDRIRELESKLA